MYPITTLFTLPRRRILSNSCLCHRRFLSTHSPIEYPLSHPIYTIWAANTGLGKTLVSAGLAISFLLNRSLAPSKFVYLKPVQTGYPIDSDSSFVYQKFSELFLHNRPPLSAFASNHVLKSSVSSSKDVFGSGLGVDGENGFTNLGLYEERKLEGERDVVFKELICKTMYGWREAVSPHLAAEREGAVVGDSELLGTLKKCLGIGSGSACEEGRELDAFCVIETAGGVASPGPSGSLQCDLYRPFRLPAIVVGDGRLGGISGTISAYETLKLRGYDVVAIVLEDHGLANEVALLSYLRNRVSVLQLPPIPQDKSDNLVAWFVESQNVFCSLKEVMISSHMQRVNKLLDFPKKAQDILWWPFTQHNLVPRETVTVIDSRCGENFAVHKVRGCGFIAQQFDACASWWTQGPDATLQIELARDMGYTAARFGHVMFPENVYEPVLECAKCLLEGVGKGWASRAYFSDNGSTAIEIALKMAFRKFLFDRGMLFGLSQPSFAERHIDLKVLALRGSYHGDTLGAMEAQAPSSYTGFLQQPWYTGRGLFLDPPTIFFHNGVWELALPERMQSDKLKVDDMSFSLRDEIFDESRDNSTLANIYSSYISQELLQHSESGESTQIGALIIEPVIQAAGGMQMIDPVFQRILVSECRSQKIPAIFDEVFTGFWRLGVESAAELLHCQPDIACFAKLMTGGIVPLAATLATEAVFEAFAGESKLKALLHGHSYSAHAMGCAAAVKSIKWFKDPLTNINLISERRLLRELWDLELANKISLHPAVQRVVTVGTLFALELQVESCNAGYASLCASSLLGMLREDGIYMRPLGNVIYLMCGPCMDPHICSSLLEKLCKRLDEFSQAT